MPKVYDDALKKLFRDNAQDFVSLVRPDLHVERLLSTELDAEHIYADGLAWCVDEDGEPELTHFEYQREKYERMGERLAEYNLLAARLNGYVPVFSVVLCLKKEKDMPRPPFIRKLRNGVEIHRFNYVCIDLNDIGVEEFLEKAKGKPSLLPLLLLTNGGNEPETVDIMIKELIAARKTDLLWIGYSLAAKVFDKDDLQWLRRRFALMNDFLWDSPVYQEIITEAETKGEARGEARGIETGKMQVLSQTHLEMVQSLLDLVNTRFPTLKALAKRCANKIDDNSTLLHLIVKIGVAKTEQEAKTVLQTSLKL